MAMAATFPKAQVISLQKYARPKGGQGGYGTRYIAHVDALERFGFANNVICDTLFGSDTFARLNAKYGI